MKSYRYSVERSWENTGAFNGIYLQGDPYWPATFTQ